MSLQETNNSGTFEEELTLLIAQGREKVASAVNSGLTQLYWSIGQRIQLEVLKGERAAYGKGLIENLGALLSSKFGRSFESKNLRRMMQFAEVFPDPEIVVTLSRQLSWSHVLAILPLKDISAREYYFHLVSLENLSVRDLRSRIEAKTFERTALASSQNQGLTVAMETLKVQEKVTPGLVFKDPYFLDFLGLRGGFDEKDLESALIRELESFLMELGRGFTFVERQKRMVIDGEDFYLDLLFYHRPLKRLVAVELKLGAFKAAHKGQMELYLKWLDKYEKQVGEETPIGLILCASASREQVELLEMHKDGITVSEYWTDLPPKAELERHLHLALEEARERLTARGIHIGEIGGDYGND